MKYLWKRAAAGTLALAIVASNVTANIECGGLLDNSTITASAADEYVTITALKTAGSSFDDAGRVDVQSSGTNLQRYTATANKGYIFDHWEYTISGTGSSSFDGVHNSKSNPVQLDYVQTVESVVAYFKVLPAPTVTTPPTAASNLTYNGSAKNLIGSTGEASSGSTMKYAVVPDGKKPATTIVTGDDEKIYTPQVGAVYKPTNSIGIYFPNHHIMYNDKECCTTGGEGNVYYNSDNGKTIIFGGGGALPDDNDAIYVESISGNVMTVKAVKADDYAQAAYGTTATATDAGKYDVYYKAVRSDGVESEADHIDATIAKATPTVTTAPTAKADLKYTGNEQPLVNAGVVANGTLEYGIAEPADVIEKGNHYVLSGNDLTVGKIFKPSSGGGFNFPAWNSVLLKNYNIVINPCNENSMPVYNSHVYVYLDATTPRIYGNYPDLPKHILFPDGCDALRIDKINDDSIEVTAVKSSECFEVKTWSATPPKCKNVGDYNVYYRVKGNDNYNDVPATKIDNVKIAKADYDHSIKPTVKSGMVYTGEEQELFVNPANLPEGATIEYKNFNYKTSVNLMIRGFASDDYWSTTVPKATENGVYTYAYRIKGDSNHNTYPLNTELNESNVGDFVLIARIEKASPLKTEPTSKNPTYNINPVQLINAGEVEEGCKIEYQLGTNSTDIPTGTWETDVTKITANQTGTFYVWYKVEVTNTNYKEVEATPITVTVSPGITAQTWTLTMDSYAYDGTAHEPVIEGEVYGEMKISYYDVNAKKSLDKAPTEVGDYRVTVYTSGDSLHYAVVRQASYSITEAKAAEPIIVRARNAYFTGLMNLAVKFKLPDEVVKDTKAYVEYSWAEGTEKRTEKKLISELTTGKVGDDKVYVVENPVYAPEMENKVTYKFFDGNGKQLNMANADGTEMYKDGYQFSLRDYLDLAMANGNDDMKALADAAYDYGIASQINFKYGDYQNLKVSDKVKAVKLSDLEKYKLTESGTLPEIIKNVKYSVEFAMDNTLRVKFNFKSAPTEEQLKSLTCTIDSKAAELVKLGDTQYALVVRNIAAPQIDTAHTFVISDGTNTYTTVRSALSYAYSAIEANSNPTLVDLAKAMFLYNQAANEKFGE